MAAARLMKERLKAAISVARGSSQPSTLEDDYLMWLGFANAGMQVPGNAYLMDLAIQRLPSAAPVIEIGSFCGLSTNMLTYLLDKHAKTNAVLGADPWHFEHDEDTDSIGNGITLDTYAQFVKDSFKRNVSFFSGHRPPHIVQMTSDEFFEAWDRGDTATDTDGAQVSLGGPISFAFIDGNHTYPFVRRDFLSVDRHLEPGGFILFDDSSDGGGFEVNLLMKEIETMPRYELVSKNPNYLFEKRAI